MFNLQRFKYLLRPSQAWGPAHKVSETAEYSQNTAMDQIHSVGAKMKQSSFDNPSFNIVYTFETNM